MLKVEHINKQLKKQQVLSDVSLHVDKGSICGIVGNNGSGKTVLFKCILGLYHVDSGEIYIDGRLRKKKDDVYRDAAALIDSPAFLSECTGLQNLQYLYELNHKKDKPYLKEILQRVGLDGDSRKKVKNYSLGMKQRLAIGQILMEDKDFIILDEPMNGLDRNGVSEMRAIFLDLKQQGKTILLASHIREDIDLLCDTVYQMDGGRISSL
ncbi:MAG: ATP-binding cassette domain-containing protein [Clostridium sp.]|nr:ATP-binding cassette domain-containing protein [Clostridium sp.]